MHGPTIIPPPPDIQPIIDKMADYVARNGPEFEFVVRRRRDERFRFLDVDHPHYAYYQHKKSVFQQVQFSMQYLSFENFKNWFIILVSRS